MSLYHKKQDYEEERTEREIEKNKLKWNRNRNRGGRWRWKKKPAAVAQRTDYSLFHLYKKLIISILRYGAVSVRCDFVFAVMASIDWSSTVAVMSKSWSDGLNRSFIVCPWWTVKLHKSPLFYLFFWRGSFLPLRVGPVLSTMKKPRWRRRLEWTRTKLILYLVSY